MTSGNELDDILNQARKVVEGKVSTFDEECGKARERVKQHDSDLGNVFETLRLKYQRDFDTEVEQMRTKAKATLESIRGVFLAIGAGALALFLGAFLVMVYPSLKDVNGLQRDILAIRTTADDEKQKLTDEIEEMKIQLGILKDLNQKAANELTATQAAYQNRIMELEGLLRARQGATR